MTLDFDDVLKALPHRPPMLLIDDVQQLEPSVSVHARRRLRADDACFAGHFPGHPVMPGVLIVEALAQAGAVLAAHSVGMEGHVPYLVGIEHAKVRKPVYPGQLLDLHVTRDRAWGRFWQLRCEARVDGETVATAVLQAALVPRAAAPPGAPAATERHHDEAASHAAA